MLEKPLYPVLTQQERIGFDHKTRTEEMIMSSANPVQLVCPHCGVLNRIPAPKLADQPICGKCRSKLLEGKPIVAHDKNLSRFIEKNELPVVVDFWAPWCGPCQQFAPVFRQIAAELKTKVCFIKVDTQENQQSSAQYQIRSIPTLVFFYRGHEAARVSGALPSDQFLQWLQHNLKQVLS